MPPKADPCQKQACNIQKCLQAHKYTESACVDVIQEMERCCDKLAKPEASVCCSGFKKPTSLTTPKSS